MNNLINFDAFSLVERVMDRIVHNYSEAELLCNVLNKKEYAQEATKLCKLANRTQLFLYADGEGSRYETEKEFEANEPVEMTDISAIRQFVYEHYSDMLSMDNVEDELNCILFKGKNVVINHLLESFDFPVHESYEGVRDAFLHSDDAHVRAAMVYEGFSEYLLEDTAEEVQEAIRECRRMTK